MLIGLFVLTRNDGLPIKKTQTIAECINFLQEYQSNLARFVYVLLERNTCCFFYCGACLRDMDGNEMYK